MSRRALGGIALGLGAAACVHGPKGRSAAHVGPDGFPSVQAAVDAAPAISAGAHVIRIAAGRWREKLRIDRPDVHLVGESRLGTILEFDAAAGLAGPDGRKWGTSRSASVAITAPGCSLSNLTVANSFDYVAARADPDHPAGAGLQAVALSLSGAADRILVEDVDIAGWQDTLLPNAGRSLFRNCRIEGAVDYIFGAGTAWFESCEILTLGRPDVDASRQGFVAAPSTLLGSPFGFVFHSCRLTRSTGLKAGSIALGRPWRPTRTFADGSYGDPDAVGAAAFLDCWMDDHIDPLGWDRMAHGAKGGGRGWTEPGDVRFFEHGSTGPGAVINPQRRQLSDFQRLQYAMPNVLGGWLP